MNPVLLQRIVVPATHLDVVADDNIWGFTSQNHDMLTRDTLVEGSGNFDYLVFNLHGHYHLACIKTRPSGQQLSAITTAPLWRT